MFYADDATSHALIFIYIQQALRLRGHAADDAFRYFADFFHYFRRRHFR